VASVALALGIATAVAGVALWIVIRPPLVPWLPHALLGLVLVGIWGLVAFDRSARDGVAPRLCLGLLLLAIPLGVAIDRQRRGPSRPRNDPPTWLIASHAGGAILFVGVSVMLFADTVSDWFADFPDLGAGWVGLLAGWIVIGAAVAAGWRMLATPAITLTAQAALGAVAGVVAGAVGIFLIGIDPWLTLLAAALAGVFVGWGLLLSRIPQAQ
jgi:hypothetical protein